MAQTTFYVCAGQPAGSLPSSETRMQTHIAKLYAASDSSLVSSMLIFCSHPGGDWQVEKPSPAEQNLIIEQRCISSADASISADFRSALRSIECTISLTVCASKGVRSRSRSPRDRVSGCGYGCGSGSGSGVNAVSRVLTDVRHEPSLEELEIFCGEIFAQK